MFSIEEYKKNPSRKVVTRDGKPVKILCTDAVNDCPIVALVLSPISKTEHPFLYNANGKYYEDEKKHDMDLFFEDEMLLTEFEKCFIQEASDVHGATLPMDTLDVKESCRKLLEIAKENVCEFCDKPMLSDIDGKKSTLHWKKAETRMLFDRLVAVIDNDDFDDSNVTLDTDVEKDEYYIELPDLLKLPKEE